MAQLKIVHLKRSSCATTSSKIWTFPIMHTWIAI